MTKLSEYLPLEAVKQNKKLQEIECKQFYAKLKPGCESGLALIIVNVINELGDRYNYIPAPTIADIIDNAESLFGETLLDLDSIECMTNSIIWRCRDNQSIEEITEYITKNLIQK